MKKTILLTFSSCLVLLILTLGVCYGGVEQLCAPGKNENIVNFIILFSLSVGISSLLFLFSLNGFRAWKRFSLFYLPIVAVLIGLSPTYGGGLYGFDKEIMTWIFSILFLLISIIIAIVKRKPKMVS